MRIKIRSPSGTQVLTLTPETTVSSFLSEIRSKTFLTGDLDIKYGYPPKALRLDGYPSTMALGELPVKLEGEQLIISQGSGMSGGGVIRGTGAGVVQSGGAKEEVKKPGAYTPAIGSAKPNAPFSFSGNAPQKPNPTPKKPIKNQDDPPDIPLPNGRGTVVLRVMEDDNSCLFRAISYVMTNSMYSVEELRQLVASTIQENPDTYSDAVLEQKRDGYCEWITMDSSWGGGIELGIFANFFDVEICTIDVATTNIIRFNEGRPKRAIVVYSGIHYDALALSPAGSLVHDSSNDVRIFDREDEDIVKGAQKLCSALKERKYFTDTKNFTLKCNQCGTGLKGEAQALDHAKKTGHSDFGEY